MIENVIIIAVLGILFAVAIGVVIHSKKSGKKCVGCPESGCSGQCTCCSEKK